MDIIAKLSQYISTKTTPYSTIYQDMFPQYPEGNTEEILCRRDPSTAVENRYLDGSRQGTFNFSYYAKSTDMEKAINQLNTLIAILDLADGILLDNETRIKIETVSTPSFVSKTEKLEYIYTAAFRLEYFVRRAS